MADVEKVTLTIAEREAIYGAGDHHPEQCDCTGYAVEYLDAPGSQHCPALVDTFEAVERIIAARLAKLDGQPANSSLIYHHAWFKASEPETNRHRPTLVLDHETSRTYAAHARSPKCLLPEQNDVLLRASKGEPVDALKFQAAAEAALSLAATRAGQSMARRTWTREARHLLYKVGAVIENHIEGLPAYAVGERSRKVKEVTAERDEARRLNAEASELLAQAKSEVDAAVTRAVEAETVVSNVAEQYNRLSKTSEERDALLAETVRERDALQAALRFAYREFGEGVGRVLDAFAVGYREARS